MHHFFRRHVYGASRPHLSRPVATVITFLISALAHELVMGCITKKLRGYGFFAMMLQMPIVMIQRSKWVKGRTLLNVSQDIVYEREYLWLTCLEYSILVLHDIRVGNVMCAVYPCVVMHLLILERYIMEVRSPAGRRKACIRV